MVFLCVKWCCAGVLVHRVDGAGSSTQAGPGKAQADGCSCLVILNSSSSVYKRDPDFSDE